VLGAGRGAGGVDVPFDFGRKGRLRGRDGAEQGGARHSNKEALHGSYFFFGL
jgi:hypothetical protein